MPSQLELLSGYFIPNTISHYQHNALELKKFIAG